ncbi:Inner membrane protein YhaI [compost metagenome]
MNSMMIPLTRYAQFDGRASRKEFWMFYLFVMLVSIVGYIGMGIGAAMGSDVVVMLFSAVLILFFLATLVPSIAVAVRRLHDTDKSGWFLLLSFVPLAGIVLLVFYVLPGTPGENRFGPVAPAV